ncbi:MAG: hypothetical protein MUQ26_08705 [Armatimonadetes bacterium]|nr:hypothetical protein [Armatimonadota bacterium]
MKGAKKPLNPMTVIAIVIIIAGGLFWRAAKGKPAHQAGGGRWSAETSQQQSPDGQAAPGRQGR